MADSEQFKYFPYAGVNPSATMVVSSGIATIFGSYKVVSGIRDSTYTPVTIYYANVNGYCYAISQNATYYNTLYTASNGSSSTSHQDVSARYTVPGTSILLFYSNLGSSASSYIPSDAFDLPSFNSFDEAAIAFLSLFPDDYVNLQYVGNGCLVNGIPYVTSGTGVLAAVTLPIGTTLSADNISVTKNGTPIDFNYNSQTQQIAFTAI